MRRYLMVFGLLVPFAALAACDQDGPLEDAAEDMEEAAEELEN